MSHSWIKYIVFSLLFLSFACHHTKKGIKSQNNKNKNTENRILIEYYRGPCYGQCPIYLFRLYSNGNAEFYGRNFVTMTGKWERKYPKETVDLADNFLKSNIYSFKDYYEREVSDASEVDLAYQDINHNVKSVRDKFSAPKSFNKLSNFVDSIALKTGNWIQTNTVINDKEADFKIIPIFKDTINQLH